MKMASCAVSHITHAFVCLFLEKSANEKNDNFTFCSRFQSFQILHRGWKPDDRHRVQRGTFRLFPVHRLVVLVFSSSEAHLAFVFSLKRGESEGKMRKRRRVLKTRTFVDDEGCIGTETRPTPLPTAVICSCRKTQISLWCSTVTEKGYESESYSEAEDDVQASRQVGKSAVPAKPAASNKQEDKKGHKKSSANANKGAKQASIMGFFQKK